MQLKRERLHHDSGWSVHGRFTGTLVGQREHIFHQTFPLSESQVKRLTVCRNYWKNHVKLRESQQQFLYIFYCETLRNGSQSNYILNITRFGGMTYLCMSSNSFHFQCKYTFYNQLWNILSSILLGHRPTDTTISLAKPGAVPQLTYSEMSISLRE